MNCGVQTLGGEGCEKGGVEGDGGQVWWKEGQEGAERRRRMN